MYVPNEIDAALNTMKKQLLKKLEQCCAASVWMHTTI